MDRDRNKIKMITKIYSQTILIVYVKTSDDKQLIKCAIQLTE